MRLLAGNARPRGSGRGPQIADRRTHLIALPAPSQGPRPVLTQLCLAVGVMSLHMESWTTVVNDLVQSLTTPADQAAAKLPCLLELLSVLPEEAENYKVGRAARPQFRCGAIAACLARLTSRHSLSQVGVMPSRRDAFRQMLRAAGPQVLALLVQVCDQCRAQTELMQQMLKCVTSWMRHVPLPSDELARSSILAFSFQASPPSQPQLRAPHSMTLAGAFLRLN